MARRNQPGFDGKRLAEVRQAAKLTQADLVARIRALSWAPRLQATDVSLYELGKKAPSAGALVALCVVLECSADYLLGLSDHA